MASFHDNMTPEEREAIQRQIDEERRRKNANGTDWLGIAANIARNQQKRMHLRRMEAIDDDAAPPPEAGWNQAFAPTRPNEDIIRYIEFTGNDYRRFRHAPVITQSDVDEVDLDVLAAQLQGEIND